MFSGLSGQPERDLNPPNLFDFVRLGSSAEDLSELFWDLFGSGFDVLVLLGFSSFFCLRLPSLCSRRCLSARACFCLGPGKEFDVRLIFLPRQFL